MRILIILLLISMNIRAQAQVYKMHWNSYSLFNPASSGVQQRYYAAFQSRAQWLGFEGAPRYWSSIADMKFDALNGGAGINYMHEKTGLTKNNSFNLNYSYHFNLQNERILSLGVSSGITLEKMDISSLIFPTDIDDPLISDLNETYTFFNYKFGIFYKSNHFEAGLSSIHSKNLTKNNVINFTIRDIYCLVSSYKFDIIENIGLKPNLLLSTSDLSYLHYSTGLMLIYNKRYWAGMSYAKYDNIGFMAGIDVKGMVRIGYSYDYAKSLINHYSYGNHEIVLAFMLK